MTTPDDMFSRHISSTHGSTEYPEYAVDEIVNCLSDDNSIDRLQNDKKYGLINPLLYVKDPDQIDLLTTPNNAFSIGSRVQQRLTIAQRDEILNEPNVLRKGTLSGLQISVLQLDPLEKEYLSGRKQDTEFGRAVADILRQMVAENY